MQNTNGAGKSYLDIVAKKDSSVSKQAAAVKAAKQDQRDLVQSLLDAISKKLDDSDRFDKELKLKQNDIILMRMASLLDEVKDEFAQDDFDELKAAVKAVQERLDDVAIDVKNIDKDLFEVDDAIIKVIIQLANDRKKDADEFKSQLKLLLESNESTNGNSPEQNDEQQIFKSKKVDNLDDEKEGDYQDSTIARDFQVLQDNITKQLDVINSSISNLTGFSVIGGFIGFASKTLLSISSSVKSVAGKVGSLTKKVVTKVFDISKAVAGGAIGFLVKSVKGIASGIGKTFGLLGKLGKGIVGGFAKIGNGIKSFGSKVGGAILHPFKAIGSFFGNKKKEKEQAKKERMRERFTEFTMNMFEKLWNFLEPILSKLKVFMLIALVPILTTAMTVVAIVAGLALLIIGAILVYKWAKKKISEFIDYVMSGQLWEDIKAGMLAAWEWMKDFGKWLWDITIKALKYIFVDVWVDLGDWIWEKLCEFGNWLYQQYIYPFVVEPIQKYVIEPLTKLWKEKIQPVIQPFIDSIMNLKSHITAIWNNFQWDENRSFFENLKCLASIVKDAVLDWWETSPFKVFYETYLDPIVKSVQDLIGRIQTIWQNFQWDENLSFIDNLMNFWEQLKIAILEWWESSTIKTYWDMLVDWISHTWQKVKEWWEQSSIKPYYDKLIAFVSDLTKPLVDWYDKSFLKKWIDKIVGWIQSIINKLDIAGKAKDIGKKAINTVGKWLGFGKKTEQTAILSSAENNSQEINIANSAVNSQITNAMQPVNSINNMNADTNAQLSQTGEEISNKAAAAEQATNDFRQQQSLIGSQSLSEIHDMREEMRRGFKDPAVVPLPMPYGPQRNAAMLYREETF